MATPAPHELLAMSVCCRTARTQRRRAAPAKYVAAALGERARDGQADARRHAGDDHHAVGVDDDAQAGPRLVIVLRALPARQQPVLLLLSWGIAACGGAQSLAFCALKSAGQEACGRAGVEGAGTDGQEHSSPPVLTPQLAHLPAQAYGYWRSADRRWTGCRLQPTSECA